MSDDNSWRVEMIQSAQDKIDEAIELIEDAVKKTDIENAVHSYVIPSLMMCAHKEHSYLASQPYNCDEIIESLENPEEEDDEDEDNK